MMMMKSKGTPGEAGVVEASQEHNLRNIAGQHPCRAVIIVVILMNALWSGQEDRRPFVLPKYGLYGVVTLDFLFGYNAKLTIFQNCIKN